MIFCFESLVQSARVTWVSANEALLRHWFETFRNLDGSPLEAAYLVNHEPVSNVALTDRFSLGLILMCKHVRV